MFNKVILTTPPDEVAFHYKFKDIEIENGDVVVTRLSGDCDKVLFRVPIEFAC